MKIINEINTIYKLSLLKRLQHKFENKTIKLTILYCFSLHKAKSSRVWHYANA